MKKESEREREWAKSEIQHEKKRRYLLRITGINNKMGESDFLYMPALFSICTYFLALLSCRFILFSLCFVFFFFVPPLRRSTSLKFIVNPFFNHATKFTKLSNSNDNIGYRLEKVLDARDTDRTSNRERERARKWGKTFEFIFENEHISWH